MVLVRAQSCVSVSFSGRAVIKRISDHGCQGLFSAPAHAVIFRFQIMAQPLRGALDNAQNHRGHILIHRWRHMPPDDRPRNAAILSWVPLSPSIGWASDQGVSFPTNCHAYVPERVVRVPTHPSAPYRAQVRWSFDLSGTSEVFRKGLVAQIARPLEGFRTPFIFLPRCGPAPFCAQAKFPAPPLFRWRWPRPRGPVACLAPAPNAASLRIRHRGCAGPRQSLAGAAIGKTIAHIETSVMPPFSVAFERKESGLADRLVDRNQRHLRKRQKTGNDRPCFIDAVAVLARDRRDGLEYGDRRRVSRRRSPIRQPERKARPVEQERALSCRPRAWGR
jgi:hypothetical protein